MLNKNSNKHIRAKIHGYEIGKLRYAVNLIHFDFLLAFLGCLIIIPVIEIALKVKAKKN